MQYYIMRRLINNNENKFIFKTNHCFEKIQILQNAQLNFRKSNGEL